MDILIFAGIILAGLILIVIEIFLIPGTSIAGIAGTGFLIYANYYAFDNFGLLGGYITLAAILILGFILIRRVMRSRTLDKVALKKNINSTVDNSAERSINVGDTGVSTTSLALIGHADINGVNVEVKSLTGFLDENTPIRVTRIDQGVILVENYN